VPVYVLKKKKALFSILTQRGGARVSIHEGKKITFGNTNAIKGENGSRQDPSCFGKKERKREDRNVIDPTCGWGKNGPYPSEDEWSVCCGRGGSYFLSYSGKGKEACLGGGGGEGEGGKGGEHLHPPEYYSRGRENTNSDRIAV